MAFESLSTKDYAVTIAMMEAMMDLEYTFPETLNDTWFRCYGIAFHKALDSGDHYYEAEL